MSVSTGDRLGPYHILDAIGAGGIGWKARDTRLDRVVAALNHPNICTLHDVGANCLVMKERRTRRSPWC